MERMRISTFRNLTGYNSNQVYRLYELGLAHGAGHGHLRVDMSRIPKKEELSGMRLAQQASSINSSFALSRGYLTMKEVVSKYPLTKYQVLLAHKKGLIPVIGRYRYQEKAIAELCEKVAMLREAGYFSRKIDWGMVTKK
jgi:outer membrane protein assembly factor BamD (BamD/ComL family)